MLNKDYLSVLRPGETARDVGLQELSERLLAENKRLNES